MDHLDICAGLKGVTSIVRNRKGAVLSRQTILKADLFHNITKSDHLQGAKHFRGINNIFGVAQPTKTGWLTILTLLKERILWVNTREEPLVYINGQPYLLRNEWEPQRKLKFAGINTERLEQLEYRLKLDILKECKSNNLLLVHDEVNGEIIPCWMAVEKVETPKELVEHFIEQGFNIKYLRLPISPEQGFVEVYVETLINAFSAQDVEDPIVINCGIGASRTTFCMVIALMVRKAKKEDVMTPVTGKRSLESLNELLKETDFQHRSLIKLMKVLEEGLQASAIQFAITRSSLLENLINAVNGNYQLVLDLVRILDKGLEIKKIVDTLIDECDHIVNIRDRILFYRIRHYTTKNDADLYKGKAQLERYYALMVTLSYILNKKDNESFSTWLNDRPEIYNIFPKSTNTDLYKPIHNLSALTTNKNDDADLYCVRNRAGAILGPNTILKVDFWYASAAITSNFRRVPGYPLYGCAQPTIAGLQFILSEIKEDFPNNSIIWVNVREEPLIYINGLPYVLRDLASTLRNITFSGITPSRLELMEQRLKSDVNKELSQFNKQILLHHEENSNIISKWEDVLNEDVLTLQQVFQSISYFRIPITAEGYPQENDFDELVQVLINNHSNNSTFVVNCQMGVGRSTMVLCTFSIIFNWLNKHGTKLSSPKSPLAMSDESKTTNYSSIHGLLRVIKNGLELKKMVDHMIDNCSKLLNIRTSIEKYRIEAESSNNETIRQDFINKGILNLQRYFILIAFSAYLDQQEPQTFKELTKFGTWLQEHVEVQQMFKELTTKATIKDLIPLEQITPGDGLALTNEILNVVKNRNGQVLAQNTILKDDCFPGCQKPSLSDRVSGAPNYRKVEYNTIDGVPVNDASSCYGVAMPTSEGIKQTLLKINKLNKTVFWTSLREEPVIYVLEKPYVLREFQEPLKNLEMTGIAKSRVELMEYNMKIDLQHELVKYGGRVLLHEEILTDTGFTINAVWQSITKEDVLTPIDMFNRLSDILKLEGFGVDYLRIPITDEQAPIPEVFDLLLQRITAAGDNDLVFNCQMGNLYINKGRGRTTTGMIISCIMKMVKTCGTSELYKSLTLENLNVYDDDIEESHLLRGEYRIILQLMSVLSQGKLAKNIVDTAIDANQQMQNLREAIYTYKCKLRQTGPNTKQYAQLHQITKNYLIRYFFLIVFCDYYLDNHASKSSFVGWLIERREITHIIRNENQDLS